LIRALVVADRLSEMAHGIERLTTATDLKVEVGAGRSAGRTERADPLPLADACACRDIDAGEVEVLALPAVAMVDDDAVAGAADNLSSN
jgi:hypothetical protein